MKRKIPVLSASFPGMLSAGILLGTLPAVTGYPFLYLLPAVALAAAFLFFKHRFAAVFTAGILLGFTSIGVHALWQLRPSYYENQLPDRNCGGSAMLRVVDPRISSVPGITPPSLIRTRVLAVQLSGEEELRASSGILYLRMPRDNPLSVRCGDVIQAEGAFLRPSSNAVFQVEAAEFVEPLRDFSAYLAGRGSARSFRAKECIFLRYEPGVIGRIAAYRDLLLERALSSIASERSRNLIGALFFGTSGGVDASTRNSLIESGTIHLFSVSGMHVAMLAAVMLLLFRPLPLKTRYLALAGVVLLYVLSTGANAPAMRAFFMIALWCTLRATLHYMPPFQTLLLAGSFLTLLSPRLLLDMGFQYSFVITAVLILAGQRFERITETLGEAFQFMPSTRFKYRRERMVRLGWRLLFAVGTCLAAFAGGAGISLYTQGLLLPGSILANLALMPVVGLLFPLLFFKLAGGLLWSGLDRLGALLLEKSFQAMEQITLLAASFFERIPAPHPALWEILLFYFALAGLLLFRRKALLLASGALLLLLPGFWIFRTGLQKPALFVAYSTSAEVPLVALADPHGEGVLVINAAGYDACGALADFLQRRGVVRIDRVAFTGARSGNLAALKLLAARLPVREAAIPDPDRHARIFLRKLEESLPGCRIVTPATGTDYGPWKILSQKNGFSLAYSRRCTTFQMMLSLESTDSGCKVTVQEPDRRREYLLSYGSIAEVLVHEFR